MLLARRPPDVRRCCPVCSHRRSTPAHREEKVLAVWLNHDGLESHYCHHCGDAGASRTQCDKPPAQSVRPHRDTREIANRLWQKSVSAQGTPAEVYLRDCRGIDLSIPNTIRYLQTRGEHPHAMITAFAAAQEVKPGLLEKLASVSAIHLIRLSPTGDKKIEKRMLGSIDGQPLVLAPPNDALGLAITEGIEDALSVHQATGLGAWAAGSSSHLAKLAKAVPDYVECVSVFIDPDGAGEKGGVALAEALERRGFEVHLVRLAIDG